MYHDKNGTTYRMEEENHSAEMQYVELPMLYYRGYQVKFQEPAAWEIAEVISGLSVLRLAVWFVQQRRGGKARGRL